MPPPLACAAAALPAARCPHPASKKGARASCWSLIWCPILPCSKHASAPVRRQVCAAARHQDRRQATAGVPPRQQATAGVPPPKNTTFHQFPRARWAPNAVSGSANAFLSSACLSTRHRATDCRTCTASTAVRHLVRGSREHWLCLESTMPQCETLGMGCMQGRSCTRCGSRRARPTRADDAHAGCLAVTRPSGHRQGAPQASPQLGAGATDGASSLGVTLHLNPSPAPSVGSTRLGRSSWAAATTAS